MHLIGSVTALLAVALPANAQLNKLAQAAGLKYFGTAVDNPGLNNGAYTKIAFDSNEFGQVTPANGQKWDSTEPRSKGFSFTNGDAVTKKAEAAGQLLRCHTLVWYNQLPSWVSSTNGKDALTTVLQTHITNVVGHYKGKCYAWDVVNEALEDTSAGTPAPYRKMPFYNALGKDYLPIAFKQAAIADPAAKLYYNDYNIERPRDKATAAIELVKNIKASGARIDGVGLQAHFVVGTTPSKANLTAMLNAFLAEVSEVAYTELDIRHPNVPASAAQNAQQATDYTTVVSACLETKGCIGITVWDFADQYSWVPSTFAPAGEACLWDKNLKPKAAYTAIANLLKSAAASKTAAAATPTAAATTKAAAAQITARAVKPEASPADLSTVTVYETETDYETDLSTVIVTITSSEESSPSPTDSGPRVSKYGQCGGSSYSGPTACAEGSSCHTINPYYFQCM